MWTRANMAVLQGFAGRMYRAMMYWRLEMHRTDVVTNIVY